MSYYYTDLLAAAWMAKHFGMAFSDSSFTGTRSLDLEGLYMENAPFYIHHDSLHLLEPKAGDLIRIGDPGIDPDICAATVFDSGEYLYVNDMGESYKITPQQTIIQRDGKPFFWPEMGAK